MRLASHKYLHLQACWFNTVGSLEFAGLLFHGVNSSGRPAVSEYRNEVIAHAYRRDMVCAYSGLLRVQCIY